MPVENLEQPVVLRTDREAGMALVKSKDGRVKWLTVSADPSSPSPSWEERVRRWASKLGVCALPSPTKQGNQGTPLSTPPPLDPPHLHHWLSAESGDAGTINSTRDVRAAGPSSEAGLSLSSPPPPPSPIENLKSDRTKQKARLKRPGSFTRGFLLGLGGGGGGCSTFRSKSPTKAGHVSDGETKESVADPASIAASTSAQLQPVQLCPTSRQDDVQGGGRVEHGKSRVDQVNTAIDTSSVVVSLSGRERWVKGASLSLTASDSSCDGDGEGEGHGEEERGGDDGSSDSNGENSGVQGDSRIGAVDVDDNGGVTPAADKDKADLDGGGNSDEDDNAWLETVNGSIHRSNSHSNDGSTGGASKTKSKKKKTKGSKGSKAKGKGSKAKASKASLANPACTTPESSKDAAEASISFKGVRKEKGKNAPNVTFGDVSLVEFTRDVGGCAVPSEGTWALALGLPFRETRVDVDGYEASKAEILAERASKLSKKQRHLATGETRQFDYRPVGERNPLFGRLDEKERRHGHRKRLLDYACFHKSDLDEADKDDHHTHDMEERGDSDELDAFSHKVSHSEFVDKSQEAAAELTALRKGRRSSQGCSCSCVRADKLNVAKLKGELSKRGLKASGSKKELTKMLRDAMQREEEEQGGQGRKVCRSDDCQCVIDGVGCHADLCSCCKGPNIGKRDLHHGGNCGNPEGVYAYSSSAVRAYRESYVTAKTVPAKERWNAIHHTM